MIFGKYLFVIKILFLGHSSAAAFCEGERCQFYVFYYALPSSLFYLKQN